MAAIREQCGVCGKPFDVIFHYQMEERDGGFAFYCSQDCLGRSQTDTTSTGEGAVTCDGCAKRFAPTLASQVFYIAGRRYSACSMACRAQLVREAQGVRLGEIAAESAVAEATPAPPPVVSPGLLPARDRRSPSPGHSLPEPRTERISEVRTVAALGNPQESNAQPRAGLGAISSAVGAASRRVDGPGQRQAPRRIAVFNHKGGTGKTTTSVSLAAGLAERGKRVLLVDTDSQGNVAVSLGASCERTLYHVLVMGLRVDDATQQLRPGLDLLPSNETLAAAELYLAGRQNRDRVLSQRMGSVAAAYDYVVIDCSPSLSLMNQNALCFADSVLVPVACDFLSLVGVRQVIKTVKNVNTLLRHRLQIWGVLPTFYDGRAKICNEALETLQNHFGDRCLRPIRATTKLKEAPAQARSIFEHAPGAHGATDYAALVDAVLGVEVEQAQRPSVHGPACAMGI